MLLDNSKIEMETSVVSIDQYKINVINSYINRAFKISTSEEILKKELDYCKKMLLNNGYNIEMLNKQIKKRIDKIEPKEKVNNKEAINIYYKN